MSRIVLVGPSWPLRGGIARTTTALAEALDRRGCLAAFETPRRQYPAWLYPGQHDSDPDACPHLSWARSTFGVLEPWTWPGVLARARRARPDALVIPYWTWVWAPLWLAMLRRVPAPALAIVHNPADHDAAALARSAARRVLGRCRGFLCHARAVADHVNASFPGRPVEVHPLPPDVSPRTADRREARARLGIAGDRCAVLCFGLIRPYKGVDVLLDAVARLPADTALTLLLCGEPWGDQGPKLTRRLASPELAGRVVARLEWVPEEQLPDYFAAADVAVLPYRSATGSAVAAQALGQGLPLVGSRVGGIAEVVRDGDNGLLVEPGDAAGLAAALVRIVDPALRTRLASGARAAASSWSWASYAEALERLVGTILARG